MTAAGDERRARAALSRVAEPGDPKVASLADEVGPRTLLDLLGRDTDVTGLRTDLAARVAALDPERDLAEATAQGIRFVVPGDDEWPERLTDLRPTDPVQHRGGVPLGLWVQGPLPLAEAVERSVAVVGARSATSYGAQVAGSMAAGLAGAGWCVVSGAAFGIDQAGHRGALGGGGTTVAVLACGVDRNYPSAHEPLLTHVREHGLVVSEAPPGSAPTRVRFLARNRIIAALTSGTVVVEAALRSGALNTANWAQQMHRVVMGVPGPVTSEPSAGVHELIRTRGANLVTGADDVLDLLDGLGARSSPERRGRERPRDSLDERSQRVLDAVPVVRAAETASVARAAGLAPSTVATVLHDLAEQRFVLREEDGWRLGPAAAAGTATLLRPQRAGAP